MSRLDVNSIRHTAGSADNITLDGSKNVTCENNLQVDGNLTVTGTIPADKLTGTAAAINGSNITNLPAANLTGTLPAISGANLTGISSAGKAHNLMINGAMQVAQRRISSTDSGYKTVDRFAYWKAGTQTQSQADIASATSGPYASGFRKCYKVVNGSNTAGNTDAATFQYSVEDQDLACSGWNHTDPNSKLTLSFWARSSVAQTFYFQIRTKHGTNQGYWSSYTLSANTWTKVTKTIPGYANIELANDNGNGMNLAWNTYYGTDNTGSGGLAENTWGAFAGGTSTPDQTTTWQNTNGATFELTGVQLEIGDSATDFAHKSYGEELLRCQRYFQVWRDVVGLIMRVHSSTQALTHVPLQSPMRNDAPTYSIGNAHQNFDLLYGGAVLASQSSSGWAFTAGGPRFGGFELMMTRGSGTFSDLNTVLHANIQFEYPDSSLPGIAQYWAYADSEL